MVTAASDVDRAEVRDALEALGMVDRLATHGRVGDPGLRDLKEDAAQRVVHLLVVLVLTLAQAFERGAEAELPQQVGCPERRVERDVQLDLVGRLGDRDAPCRERRELRAVVRPGCGGHIELSVDHAVCAVTDHGEFVRQTGVHRVLVPGIGAQAEPDRR